MKSFEPLGCGQPRARFVNAEAVSTFSGIAPVTSSSSKSLTHRLRYLDCARCRHDPGGRKRERTELFSSSRLSGEQLPRIC